MTRTLLIVASLLICILPGLAQEINFESLEHDFGQIKEVDGPVTKEFVFTNSSTDVLRITNVKASCGCTTPGWSKEEIAPGESGYVKAMYNPANRPGPFRKSLTVTIAGISRPVLLYIKGTVEGRPRSIEEQFPAVIGDLRMKYKSVNFGRIKTTGKQNYRYLEVYNQGDSAIAFSEFYESPHYIALKFEPEVLGAKERGRIRIAFNAAGKDDLGFFSEQVMFRTDEGIDAEKEFTVLATIEEYFAPLTAEEAAIAPKLSIVEQMKDFGTVDPGKTILIEIPLSNKGKSMLNFRKIVSSCDCLKVQKKESLAPGAVENLILTLDTRGLKGRVYNAVYLYSNDPRQPTQMIRLTGSVRQGS